MSLKGRWIKIQSYKHDGSLHRFWKRNFVLVDDQEWLIVASKKHELSNLMAEFGIPKNQQFLF